LLLVLAGFAFTRSDGTTSSANGIKAACSLPKPSQLEEIGACHRGDLNHVTFKLGEDKMLKGVFATALVLMVTTQTSFAGRDEDPADLTTKVQAESTDVFEIRFRVGELAVVTVSGDGDTDLDLYVYDENGNLVDKDDDYTDECVAIWIPRWTGRFTIRVVNIGAVYNRYRIAMN
jgi:hypothetical protein